MTIKAVLFDLDDTLLWDDQSVKEAFTATCNEAARHYSIQSDRLEEAVRHEARALYQTYDTFPFTQMIGINPFEALWANFSEGDNINFIKLRELAPGYRKESWQRGLKALGIDDLKLGGALAEQFPAERRVRPIVYEETFRVLGKIQETYKLLLLTNGSPDLQKEKVAGVPELASYFDHIVISGSFGAGKPDISIFQHALDLLQISASEGIMVGDKLTTDILGSNRIGMKSVWINRHGITRSDVAVPDYEIANLEQLEGIIQSLS